jgi:hypothetical protein
MTDTVDNTWYKNRMVWMIIAIPALTVVGCMLTIYLAISNPEIIVQDPEPGDDQNTSVSGDTLP